MYVVHGTNRREESPDLDMVSVFSGPVLPETGAWKPAFVKTPVGILLTDVRKDASVSLRVRGYVCTYAHETTKIITEAFVGGTRVPVIEAPVIGRVGNKVFVEVRLMVSTRDMLPVDDSCWSWSLELGLPHGFHAATLFSPRSHTSYLCALVEDPTAVATDISPASFCLVWPRGSRDGSITVNGDLVDLPPGSPSSLRVAASPETRYTCVVDNGIKRYEVVLETPGVSREAYTSHYRSCRVGAPNSRTYDLSLTDPGVVTDLRRLGIIRPGDRVVLKEGAGNELLAVGSGETISTSGSFYVIPSYEDGSDQYLCLKTPEGSHLVSFDNTESFVGHNSSRYFHGDRFVVGSRLVEVAKGSLILIVHDDAPLLFPGGVTTASQVSTAGDIVLRDLIMKSSSQVTAKASSGPTYGSSSYYVYDSVNGTTLEATRVKHGLDEAGETGSMSLNVLYTPPTGPKVLRNAMEIDPSETTISAIDATGSLDATFDASGLRFNSNSGDVYFGSAQEFRIHFEPASGNDPSMLQIQGYSSDTSSYVTRQLITNEPVG